MSMKIDISKKITQTQRLCEEKKGEETALSRSYVHTLEIKDCQLSSDGIKSNSNNNKSNRNRSHVNNSNRGLTRCQTCADDRIIINYFKRKRNFPCSHVTELELTS